MTSEERWRDIQDYEGVYEVSNMGRVRRVATERVLKGNDNGLEVVVTLSKLGKTHTFRIATLVAGAWVQKPEEEARYVNHINNDYADNRAENLAWRAYQQRGERVGDDYYLTPYQIRAIRQRISRGESCAALSKEFHVDVRHIYKLVE